MKTIVTVVSIRPDIPRLQATLKALDNSEYNHIIVASGQHYDHNRFGVFFDEFGLRKPDYTLTSGAPGRSAWDQSHILGNQLVDTLNNISPRPDLVIYLGDSNSVMSAVAVKRAGYRICHIEAFMRAYHSPQAMFASGTCSLPEELNRRIITQAADIFFTYHEDYLEHAVREGVPLSNIRVVPNTINEAVSYAIDLLKTPTRKRIGVDIHRQENIDSPDRLQFILNAARVYSNTFKVPVEMLDFSRTTEVIKKSNLDMTDINLVPLMGYKDYLSFQQDSLLMISDSGSFGEEVSNFPIPVPGICPRTNIERPRAISGGSTYMLQMTQESLEQSLEWLNKYDPKNVDRTWLGSGLCSTQILAHLRDMDGSLW